MVPAVDKLRQTTGICRVFAIHQMYYDSSGVPEYKISKLSTLYTGLLLGGLMLSVLLQRLCPSQISNPDVGIELGFVYWVYFGDSWNAYILICCLLRAKSQCKLLNHLVSTIENVDNVCGRFTVDTRVYTWATLFSVVQLLTTNLYITVPESLCNCMTHVYLFSVIYYFGIQITTMAASIEKVNQTLNTALPNTELPSKRVKNHDGWVQNCLGNDVDRSLSPLKISPEDTVHNCCKLYHELYDAAMKFNHVFGWAIIGMVAHLAATCVISVYYVYAYYPCTTWLTVRQQVSNVGWFIYGLSSLVLIVHPCYKINSKCVDTLYAVNGYLASCTDDGIYHELSKFWTILQSEIIELAPLGLIRLNYNLILTILGSAVSYIIILAQFSKGASCFDYRDDDDV